MSGNFFDVLGVVPVIGRTLTPAVDKVRNAEPYVVLSYEYWIRRFGGDTSVLNQVVDLNGHPMTVIGVAQRGFVGFNALSPSDVFVPLSMKTAVTPTWDDMSRRNSIWLKVFARLSPGMTAKRAETAMSIPYRNGLENDLKSSRLWSGTPQKYLKNALLLKNASKGFGQTQQFYAKPLYVLLAMVGTLLLIACANIANLLVTRASGRQREVAIRLSLGATRGALISLIMTESGAIAVVSGALGLVFAAWIAPVLLGMLPIENIGAALDTTPDWRVLAFTAGLSLFTAILFGLAPAWQTTRPDLAPTLKNESGSLSAVAGQNRLRRALVACQVALSMLLLFGAGLFARSLYNLLSVPAGFAVNQLLELSIDPSLHGYAPARARSLFMDAQSRLDRLPGVVAASASSSRLLDDGWMNTVHVEGYHPTAGEDMNPGFNEVMPGFFSTVGAPLIAGREFTAKDIGAANVAIVNETFVKRFLPHTNPLARHLGWGDNGPMPYEIVGVVKDFKAGDVKESARPWTFTALLQDEHPGQVTFYMRARGNPTAVARDAQETMKKLDPSLPVFDVKTITAQIEETSFVERMFAVLSGAFGFFATLLASVGLYGITAYSVTRRTREIGIRIALGAERGSVLRLVMGELLALTVIGLGVGIAAALALGRIVQSLLFGIEANDPVVLAGAAVLILVVAMIAAWAPARRAASIDPLLSLRHE